MLENRFIASELFGQRTGDFHAHHKNERKLDNCPNNLEWKACSEHHSHHATKRNLAGTFGWQAYGVHPRGMLGKHQTERQKEAAREWNKKRHNHIVKKIEFIGYRDVYDITVPEHENFVANNVVVHNSGKTAITGMYLRALRGSGLFLVDELTLLKQAQAELEKWIGEPVGEIGDNVCEPRRITVATIQTIHRHHTDATYRLWMRKLQVMIIDEVHIALNRRNFETVAAIQPPVVFGLTATLELKKKNVAMRAYELCGPVVFTYPLERGVREHVLSKGIAVSVQVHNEVAEPTYPGGGSWWQRRLWYRRRYPKAYRDLIVNGELRNEVIRELVETCHAQGKYTIVLVDRKQHLRNLSALFGSIPHELVFGEKQTHQRIASKRKFEQGSLRVLLVNKVFKKGIDIKRVDVIIDGAAMKSRNDAIQKYGRGVRMCEGKTGLIYLDIADTGNRFQKAAHSRGLALRKIGIPLYRVGSELGAQTILNLAEDKLAKLMVGQITGKKTKEGLLDDSIQKQLRFKP